MASIFDYVSATEIAAYIEELPSNKIPYLGETLFPMRKQVGTDISWIKGSDNLPIAITPSNYDAKATLRERTAFGKMSTEMAFFREAMRIGERDRQEMNKLLNNPQSPMALPIIRNIFDDAAKLVEGVRVQAEYMRMQLIQTGGFTVKNALNSVSYKFDYNMQSSRKITVTNKWTDPTKSDPVADIKAACKLVEDETGVRPTRIIMNSKTFDDMVASESIKKSLMIGVSGGYQNLYMEDTEIQRVIERRTQTKIQVYSKMIGELDPDSLIPNKSVKKKLIEDGKVVLLPEGTLGETWYGTTPEESDLLGGSTDANVQVLSGGACLTTYKEKHPVNVVTIVSAVMAPSFEAINNVAVLTVQ